MAGYDCDDDVIYVTDAQNAQGVFVPESIIKDIPGNGLPTEKPYLCFLFAHDIDPASDDDDDMERYFYRIWAVDEDSADWIFMKQPEIIRYIESVKNDAYGHLYGDLQWGRPTSIYEIDRRWGVLVVVLEEDPR